MTKTVLSTNEDLDPPEVLMGISRAEVTAIVRAIRSETGNPGPMAQQDILLHYSRNVPWLRQLQEQKSAAVRARQAASLFAVFDLHRN